MVDRLQSVSNWKTWESLFFQAEDWKHVHLIRISSIDLPELDENIFDYIVQSLEHQCLVVHRQKNYEDTIRCDACHRVCAKPKLLVRRLLIFECIASLMMSMIWFNVFNARVLFTRLPARDWSARSSDWDFQKCYGIVEYEDEWLCLSCQDNNLKNCCCLCDQPGGALKSLLQSS